MSENWFVMPQMTKDDVELAVDWAAHQESWNPGLNDAACFCNTDHRGFFIGKLKGEPTGCFSALCRGPIGGTLNKKEKRI